MVKLCKECKGYGFNCAMGVGECGHATPSMGWVLCISCSDKENRCAACGKPIVEASNQS